MSTTPRRILPRLLAAAGIAAAAVAVPSQASAQDPTDPSIAEIAQSAGLDTLVAAVTEAGLAGDLADCTTDPFSTDNPVTVFAPTEAAFAAVPEDLLTAALGDPDGLLTTILTYHVVPGYQDAATVTAASSLTTAQGSDITVDGTVLNGSINIVDTDITACNGIVHTIDGVLVPELPSIADLAADNELATLLTAAQAAGLDAGLADCSADPVTVFAPTDAAFEALPADVLDAALADPDGLLTTVLTYHVVPGLVGSAEVVESTSLTTAQGEDIAVDGTVLNGSANIVTTDVWGCNGVVHVIDAVLLPPSVANPTTTTAAPTSTVQPADDLPATGDETTYVAVLAGAFLLAGLALLGVRRRQA